MFRSRLVETDPHDEWRDRATRRDRLSAGALAPPLRCRFGYSSLAGPATRVLIAQEAGSGP